jgi:hypothetical protein
MAVEHCFIPIARMAYREVNLLSSLGDCILFFHFKISSNASDRVWDWGYEYIQNILGSISTDPTDPTLIMTTDHLKTGV